MKWTEATYRSLYEQILDRCGPYSTWHQTRRPGTAKLDAAFEDVKCAFAQRLNTSVDAVEAQIAYVFPIQNKETLEQGRARLLILNIAAAFHAGFIENRHFPYEIVASSRHIPTLAEL
jgi:hypothetical protein